MEAKVNYKKGELVNGLTFIDDVEPHILPSCRKGFLLNNTSESLLQMR